MVGTVGTIKINLYGKSAWKRSQIEKKCYKSKFRLVIKLSPINDTKAYQVDQGKRTINKI